MFKKNPFQIDIRIGTPILLKEVFTIFYAGGSNKYLWLIVVLYSEQVSDKCRRARGACHL